MRKLSTFRLIPDVQRVPLGSEIERVFNVDQLEGRHRLNHPSPYAHRLLERDELANGDVVVKRPDGVVVHLFQHAIESKGVQ